MFRISAKSQYGLRMMVYLAKCKREVCPLKLVSKDEGISFDYLEKIISNLEKAELVKAKKGVQGGYFLAKKASKIKISDIISALENRQGLVKCTTKKSSKCPLEKRCLAKSFWCKVQKALDSALNSVTLSDLLKK